MKPPPPPQESPLQTSNYPNGRPSGPGYNARTTGLLCSSASSGSAFSSLSSMRPFRWPAQPPAVCSQATRRAPEVGRRMCSNRHTGRGLRPGNWTSADVDARQRRAGVHQACSRRCVQVPPRQVHQLQHEPQAGATWQPAPCTELDCVHTCWPTFAQSAMMLFQ